MAIMCLCVRFVNIFLRFITSSSFILDIHAWIVYVCVKCIHQNKTKQKKKFGHLFYNKVMSCSSFVMSMISQWCYFFKKNLRRKIIRNKTKKNKNHFHLNQMTFIIEIQKQMCETHDNNNNSGGAMVKMKKNVHSIYLRYICVQISRRFTIHFKWWVKNWFRFSFSF